MLASLLSLLAFVACDDSLGPRTAVRGGTYRLASGNTMTVFASMPFAMHETAPDGGVVWSMTGDSRFTNAFRVAPWTSIAGEVEVDAMP